MSTLIKLDNTWFIMTRIVLFQCFTKISFWDSALEVHTEYLRLQRELVSFIKYITKID